MENCNGLMADSTVAITSGTAEREAAVMMLDQNPGRNRIILSAEREYDCKEFIEH